jgi:prepilin-type N-terminal cleavage/methylation domain-containing protein
MIKNTKNAKGFTLVEILFALFIGLLLLGTVYVSMISGQRSSAALEDKIVAQQDARAALELMALEIGMASYNPNFVPGIWRDGPAGTCGGVALNQTFKGIQEATTNSITVEMDIDENSTLGGANETIRYVYNPAVGQERITRETNCGGGAQPFLGDVQGTQGRSVRVINNTLIPNIPMFRYFDGMGVEIPAGSLPAGIPNIRRIEITLAVETEDIDPNSTTMQRRRMIYSTSVITRNHAINL